MERLLREMYCNLNEVSSWRCGLWVEGGPVIIRLTLCVIYSWLLLEVTSSCQPKAYTEPIADSYHRSLVDTILNHSDHEFVMIDKGDANFYYEPDSFFDKNINTLMEDALASRDKCIRLMSGVQPDYKLKIIYFNDREKLRPYLNMTPKGVALPDAHTLLIATNETTRAYHLHEMMHIVSINQFGGYAVQPLDWIQEGIAVYADNPCMQYPIHAISAHLLYTKKLPAFDSLFYHFRTLPDIAAYMTAGSVSQFIIETNGLDKFEQIWRQGIEKLPQIIGKSKKDFEVEYHAFLRQHYPNQPYIDWDLLDKEGCG